MDVEFLGAERLGRLLDAQRLRDLLGARDRHAEIGVRLARLDELLGVLVLARERARSAVTSDTNVQLQVERALQVSIQICIDVGAHLVSELGLGPAEDYQGVFAALGRAGKIDSDLADRLGDAAGLRNLLVHDYGEIDHARL